MLHIKVGEVSGVSGASIRGSEIDIDITTDKTLFNILEEIIVYIFSIC